jgi:Holliday junction resolvase-like predicted endonuclease
MDWKNNSHTYYRWWFQHVGFNYLTLDQKILAVHNLQAADDQWWVAASRKALSLRTGQDRADGNTLARTMGRKAEKDVADYLQSKGWEIHVQPSENLRPKYGTSTSGYDIVASHGATTIKVEVKALQESSPLWTLGPKCWASIKKAKSDYLVIVKGDDIRFVAVKDLAFDEPIYVHDGLDYAQDRALKYLLVINPACLKRVCKNA